MQEKIEHVALAQCLPVELVGIMQAESWEWNDMCPVMIDADG